MRTVSYLPLGQWAMPLRPFELAKNIAYGHLVKHYAQMCMKITKIVATRCQILSLKCTKFNFEGAYSTPPDL